MPYLIDGHNLIGQLPDLDFDDPHDEARLVERLKGAMGRKRKRCTVVFDGGLPGGPSRDLSTSSVRVVFAHGGTSADAIIIERIRQARDPQRWIVVTADHAIIDVARQHKVAVLSPTAFARELTAPAPTADPDAKPQVGPDEVEEWLRLFGGQADES